MSLENLLPDLTPVVNLKRGYITNDIKYRNIMVYGGQGTGKSEFCRAFAEKVVERYGVDKSANILSRFFNKLITSVGLINVPVQVYYWEDSTLKKNKDSELAAFYNVRHISAAKTGRTDGLILTINNIHALFGIKKDLRETVDAWFFRSLPADDYDIRIAKNILGEENFIKFQEVIRMRDNNPKLMGLTYYNIRGERGCVDWNHAKKNYLMDLDTSKEVVDSFTPQSTGNLTQLKIELICKSAAALVMVGIYGYVFFHLLLHLV